MDAPTGTRILCGPEELQRRLDGVRAVLFDWDGVFNGGFKDREGGSPFSEVDSMGVNLLRFALWLKNGTLPVAAVISGQHNPLAEQFARREHLHAIYTGFTNKPEALERMHDAFKITAGGTAFFFDDVLDLPVAVRCGLRIMIGRAAGGWLESVVEQRRLADLITAGSGADHGLREACEFLIARWGGEAVIDHRVGYTPAYQDYLAARNAVVPREVRNAR